MKQAPPSDTGFQTFNANTEFLQHVHRNGHVPLWVHPKLADQLIKAHGHSGLIVPHPNIDLEDLTK